MAIKGVFKISDEACLLDLSLAQRLKYDNQTTSSLLDNYKGEELCLNECLKVLNYNIKPFCKKLAEELPQTNINRLIINLNARNFSDICDIISCIPKSKLKEVIFESNGLGLNEFLSDIKNDLERLKVKAFVTDPSLKSAIELLTQLNDKNQPKMVPSKKIQFADQTSNANQLQLTPKDITHATSEHLDLEQCLDAMIVSKASKESLSRFHNMLIRWKTKDFDLGKYSRPYQLLPYLEQIANATKDTFVDTITIVSIPTEVQLSNLATSLPSNIKFVDLSFCKVGSKPIIGFISNLGENSSLEYLNIRNCGLTPTIDGQSNNSTSIRLINALSKTAIRILEISSTEIGNQGIDEIVAAKLKLSKLIVHIKDMPPQEVDLNPLVDESKELQSPKSTSMQLKFAELNKLREELEQLEGLGFDKSLIGTEMNPLAMMISTNFPNNGGFLLRPTKSFSAQVVKRSVNK